MTTIAAMKPRRFGSPLAGSYAPDDCLFLLKPIESPVFRSIEDKERLIQSGRLHYSQTIHREQPPSRRYTRLFLTLTQRYKARLAEELMALAAMIAERRGGRICLVSLARAGTPIGVLLRRALKSRLGRDCDHYSISIIRDRGIDRVALDYLIQELRHEPESLVFVDGWTAKGVITRELKRAVAEYNATRRCRVPNELFVVSDIGGSADVAATCADYTIPSALMNSTVSGLVSRSILNDAIGPNDFHGCVRYDHLAPHDRSVWFIERIAARLPTAHRAEPVAVPRQERQAVTTAFLDRIRAEHGVSDLNRIKPGIAEATRVMLRRVPDLLMVRDPRHPDVAHLVQLSEEKRVALIRQPDMPFGACALIKDVTKETAA